MTWYVPFHVSTDDSDYGYKAYISAEALDAASHVWIACTDGDGEVVCVEGLDTEG